MMRYFEGYDQQAAKPAVWPKDKTAINPGPTLRVKVGERVEITLLNQVDSGAFPVLGDIEEWTITNNTNVPHPFHIHVNPFQVVEVNDPNSPGTRYLNEEHGVWQDVVNVPSALKYGATAGKENGNVVLGEAPISPAASCCTATSWLTRDRGMMQLVRVIDGATTIKHH